MHPKLRFKARKFISNAKRKGYDLRITESLRTFDRQNNLYAQGRTTSGQIVTNATAGSSYHNYGLAIDVVDRNKGYNTNWAEIGQIGKKAGFEWGGDWQNFKDMPHFQLTLGKKTAELKQLYNSGKWKNYPTATTLSGLNGKFENEIESFVKKSLNDKDFKDTKKIGFVTMQFANKIKKIIQKNTANFSIMLNADEIRKIFKDHSNSSSEMKRGLLPVSIEDFKKITEIINKPDVIDNAGKRKNLNSVLLVKYFSNEKTFTILDIHVSNGYLKIKTMYKRPI